MSVGEAERADGAPEGGIPPDESAEGAAELRRALAEAQQQAAALRDQYLRSVAEFDNMRKRTQREVENASRSGLERFAAEILPVKDSLDLAVDNAGRADAKALLEGQEATLKLLAKAFDKLNIRTLDPVGEPFDPALHEAVMAQESKTAEPNSVLQVVQRGYALNGRLLRPARVIVAKAPAPAGTGAA